MNEFKQIMAEIKENGFAFSKDSFVNDALRYMGYGIVDLNNISKKKEPDMHEYFKLMHKQDGTSEGRPDHGQVYNF